MQLKTEFDKFEQKKNQTSKISKMRKEDGNSKLDQEYYDLVKAKMDLYNQV